MQQLADSPWTPPLPATPCAFSTSSASPTILPPWRPLPCVPALVKPLPSSLLVFRRDQDRRVIEWISLTDDSSTTLDDARCEHLRGALTIDADPEGRLYVLSERLRRLTLLDARGAVQSVLPWTMPGDPISVHCLDAGSFLIGTWKPGALYVLDREGRVLWSWTPGRTILAEARAAAMGADGAYYVADASLHRILAVTPSGRVVRQVGIAGSPGSGPGRFANPSMLEVDEDGRRPRVRHAKRPRGEARGRRLGGLGMAGA